jgi:mycoredoxin
MIKMYGAEWCIDCRQARMYFERNDIEFEYIDVSVEVDEMDTVIRYNEGRRSIPVVVFRDGTHLTEPTDAELEAKLAG